MLKTQPINMTFNTNNSKGISIKFESFADAVHCEDEQVKGWIRAGVEYLIDNPKQISWTATSGDTLVACTRMRDDCINGDICTVNHSGFAYMHERDSIPANLDDDGYNDTEEDPTNATPEDVDNVVQLNAWRERAVVNPPWSDYDVRDHFGGVDIQRTKRADFNRTMRPGYPALHAVCN